MTRALDEGRQADISRLLSDVADAITEDLPGLTDRVVHEFDERMPDLPDDPAIHDLLRGSTSANLETVAHLLRGHIPVEDIEPPAAAAEYARRLAQRGTPASLLLRAYRLGQAMVLQWAHELIAASDADAEAAYAAGQSLTETTFRYIDAVSEGLIVAYQAERERWAANRSAVQRETVEALLADTALDPVTAEHALGYRLRQHHLGVVVWAASDAAHPADLGALQRATSVVAKRLDASGQPLFIPRDRETAWGWIPLGRAADTDPATVGACLSTEEGGLRIAMGCPGAGEVGFRRTHLEAWRAHRVAVLGHEHAQQITSYADQEVRTAAILAADLEATRELVAATLGDLREDSEAAERMRETLLVFLQERDSYVATAGRLHLHKNSVRYRIDRAAAARGRPLQEDRLDLELALVACKWLMPALGSPTIEH